MGRHNEENICGEKTFGLRQKNDNETKKIKKIRTHQERWVGVGWEAKSDSEKKSSSPSHRC